MRSFLPSRFTDGYGVSVATVERLADEGCDVLVTVDCGTTAVDSLTRAAELGIESIVCDHHLAGGVRPPGIIANPALGRGSDALPAAAGVTFKLVQALAQRLDGDRLAPAPEVGLDLAALATVADAVPLVGENRRIVARGLAAFRAAPRPGLSALCAAASISPRGVNARDLGWNLAPAINASGRMSHPDQALELLLADSAAGTAERASALWNLNMERREVEQRVTAEAIAILDATPDEVTGQQALVVAGDGWHEGVVGIVASRLVERFGRPTIVMTMSGDTAKGSGRSLPGVDLHSLVASASGPLERWGGHAGAIGLQMAVADIAEFRVAFAAAAESVEGVIARARVKIVDGIVGVRDLTLQTAEALETLQPFGNGNPEVRLVVPGCLVESAATMGEGKRHLQMRLRSGSAHARGLWWRMGERLSSIAVGERHDAIVQLGVERWQELVGPRVTLEGLDQLATDPAPAELLCQQVCDSECPQRITAMSLSSLVAGAAPETVAPVAGPARGVRDLRGHGAVLSTVTALVHADRGVVAVVADVSRRRALLEGVLSPRRLGAEVAVLAGERCDAEDARARLAAATDRPLLAMIDYGALAQHDLPPETHVALVDPPADEAQAAWVQAHAERHWLHLLWGAEEVAFARSVADARWSVRAVAATVWRALTTAADVTDERDLVATLLGTDDPLGSPAAVADAVRALSEAGLITIDAEGVHLAPDAGRRDLAATPTAQTAAARLAASHDFLDRVDTLTFGPSAISLGNVRQAG